MKAALLTLRDALTLVMNYSRCTGAEVKRQFRSALLDGTIRAEGNVNRFHYLAPRWERVGREFWTAAPDWRRGTAVTSAGEDATEIHVPRVDVERVFSDVQPASSELARTEPTIDGAGVKSDGARGRSTSKAATAGAETRCRTWLKNFVAAGQRPASRAAVFRTAKTAIGPTLSEKAFLRVWRAEAPQEWKLPGVRGAKRSESIRRIDSAV